MRGCLLALCATLALTACSGGPRTLHSSRTATGTPDEFSVLPALPLQRPNSMSALPEPTPGGSNLADPQPVSDAIVALGGNPAAGVTDAALLAQAGRFGSDPAIRATLAEDDASYRRRRGVLGGWNIFRKDRYYSTYRGMSLDAYAEWNRFRALGVAVPSAPPAD